MDQAPPTPSIPQPPASPSRVVLLLRALNPLELFFGPVFQREVRVMGRKKGTYWTRGLFALALFSFCALFYLGYRVDADRLSGAARLQQFQSLAPALAATIAWSQLVAVVLVAPLLTGPLICDEKRNRTISALATSPLPALHIVFGGLLSRLVQLTILLLVAAPLMLALRAFGGLDVILILGTTCLTASTAILAAALGVWGSVHARRPWNGAAFALLALIILSFLPLMLWGLANVSGFAWLRTAVDFFSRFATFFAMLVLTVPEAGRGMPFGSTDMWISVSIGNLCLALACCLLAAFQLRGVLIREAAETPPGAAAGAGEGAVSPREFLKARLRALRRRPALRLAVGLLVVVTAVIFVAVAYTQRDAYDLPMVLAAWFIVLGTVFCLPPRKPERTVSDTPVYWRESHQEPFGSPTMALFTALAASTAIALAYANGGLLEEGVAIVFSVVGTLALCLHTATAASGAIAGEVQSRTWSALLTTPLSPREIISGKVFGLARRLWLVPAAILLHLCLVVFGGELHPLVPLVVALHLVFGVIFLCSLGVLASLVFRRATPAAVWTVLFAVGVWAVLPGLVAFIAAILNWDRRSAPPMHAVSALITLNPVMMNALTVEGGMDRTSRFDMPTGRMGLAPFLAMCALGWAGLLALAWACRRAAESYFPKAAAADR